MQLSFSYNWNNKLDCKAFTTIRMFNPTQHIVGNKVEIDLKGQSKGSGTIMDIRRFLVKDLNAFVSYLDTGYSVAETQEIFRKMYSKTDLDRVPLALLLIVKDKV